MTSAIGDGLAALTFQLAEMCAMASQAMDYATQALLQADLEAAEAVTALHEHTAAMGSSADETTFLLLALHSPSAANLRQIVNAIRIAGDAERMGELAVQVAEIARRHHPQHAVPTEVSGRVAELSALAIGLARAVQEVLVSREPRLVASLCSDGSAADDLHRQLLAKLIDSGWTHGVAAGVDVARICRLYEGFVDHALHIAQRFAFQTNGHRPRLAQHLSTTRAATTK
ncbi:Phosphate-specific transport system accessory protein PhoU [Mycobacterium simulans]|uniref:phosphate signaling complex PhoU family protein n=1 Tax=Mycobacterium simulans TaxID=627089 RepID=UPI00174A44A5|nr:PhoU domain-containing protein [Mycobacterium simulans]SON58689.1 Phosphate-specific transport system accessory protein PhoU [Mycobacterium simulans]